MMSTAPWSGQWWDRLPRTSGAPFCEAPALRTISNFFEIVGGSGSRGLCRDPEHYCPFGL